MGDAIPIGRIAGFPVRAHWSVLVILWLFTWSLADTLPHSVPGHSPLAYWLAGVGGAVVLLASLLAHELAHAVQARRAGVEVTDVTLWLFGGVTRLGGQAPNPGAEFRLAASGPATSLGLAGVFAGVAFGLDGLGVAHIVVGVVWWLSGVNLLLGLFNLLPGAPLDGGQILHAYLWRRSGDRVRAAVSAARAGRAVAFVLIAIGLLEFVLGSIVGGVWMVFLGWFLFTAARDEENQVLTNQSLAGVRVADAMTPDPRSAPGSMTVDDFIHRFLLGERHSAYPVEAGDGSIIGLITLSQLRQVPPGQRDTTLLADVAIPLAQVPTATAVEPLLGLLARLTPHTGNRALVVQDDGHVVGIVTASDVTRLIDARRLILPGPAAGQGV